VSHEPPHVEHAPAIEIDLSLNPEHFLLGFSDQISDIALFVASEQLPRLGEHRVVRLTLPTGDVVDAVGEVKLHRSASGARREGFVLQFLELDELDRMSLQAFLRASTAPLRASQAPSSQPASQRRHSGRMSAVVDVKVGVDVEAHVTLDSDHNFFAGFSENISEGGVFVQSWLPKKVGEHVTLRIVLPDDEDDPIDTVGEVRWVRPFDRASEIPPGFGVAFLDLAARDKKRIDRFLEQRKPLFYDD
jgi:uncharacterized protein (TIGR02266 family)